MTNFQKGCAQHTTSLDIFNLWNWGYTLSCKALMPMAYTIHTGDPLGDKW